MSGCPRKAVHLDETNLGLINLFLEITGRQALDAFHFQGKKRNSFVFLVDPRDLGPSIGRGGSLVKALRAKLGEEVVIFPRTDSLESTIRGIVTPVKLTHFSTQQTIAGLLVYVGAESADKPKIIGVAADNLARLGAIITRHFEVAKVLVAD
jgi:NusA-like KH domain protein